MTNVTYRHSSPTAPGSTTIKNAPLTNAEIDGNLASIVTSVDAKQATLVSGTTIKTINSNPILGSGDLSLQATLVSGTTIKTVNSVSVLGSGNISVQATLVSGTNIKTVNSTTLLGSGDLPVQPTLVSGTNIRTINSVSILGSGDISVQSQLVSGTNIKTVNGLSIMGSGDISTNKPVVLVSALTQTVTAGSLYCLTNNTPQAAATNLILFSTTFSNATWTKFGSAQDVGITVTENFNYAPDGNFTADQVVMASVSVSVSLRQNMPVYANGIYTYSVWARQTSGTAANIYLDIADGASSITALSTTWQRFTVTTTIVPSFCDIFFSQIGTYEVWGAQLESGSVATSNIQTLDVTATRAANVVSPQRLILPLSVAANDTLSVNVANGITTNVIDPNGKTICDAAGPMTIDAANATVNLQYINNSWRII
jgi:hypothetical protein